MQNLIFDDQNYFQSLNVLNRNLAGSELFMKPNDMLKFGKLVLNKGEI